MTRRQEIVRGALLGAGLCLVLALRNGPTPAAASSDSRPDLSGNGIKAGFGYVPPENSDDPVDQLIHAEMRKSQGAKTCDKECKNCSTPPPATMPTCAPSPQATPCCGAATGDGCTCGCEKK